MPVDPHATVTVVGGLVIGAAGEILIVLDPHTFDIYLRQIFEDWTYSDRELKEEPEDPIAYNIDFVTSVGEQIALRDELIKAQGKDTRK
jgi:hypothetical protein